MFKKIFILAILTLGVLFCGYAYAASDLDFCLFPGKCGNEIPTTPSQPSSTNPPVKPEVPMQVMPNGDACFCFNVKCNEQDQTTRKFKSYDVAFVVDVSGTMAHGFLKTINNTQTIQIPINNVMDSVRKILDDKYLNEAVDKVALVAFGNTGTIKINWTADFKTKVVQGKKQEGAFIKQLALIGSQVNANPDCNTNLAGGFMAVNELFKNARKDSSKIVIVLSDGVMNAYTLNGQKKECAGDGYPVVEDECVRQAVGQSAVVKNQGIKIYAIGYSIEGTGKEYTGQIKIGSKLYNYQDKCWRTTVPAHLGAGEFAEENVLKKIVTPGDNYYVRDEDFSNLTGIFKQVFEREVKGSVIPGVCKNMQVRAELKSGLLFDNRADIVKQNAPKGVYSPSQNPNVLSFDTTKFVVKRDGKNIPLTQLNKNNTLTFRLYVAKGYKGKGGINATDILDLVKSSVTYTNNFNAKTQKLSFKDTQGLVWTSSPDCQCKAVKTSAKPKIELSSEIIDKCTGEASFFVRCLEDDPSKPSNIPCQNVALTVSFPAYMDQVINITNDNVDALGNNQYKVYLGTLTNGDPAKEVKFSWQDAMSDNSPDAPVKSSLAWSWQDSDGSVVEYSSFSTNEKIAPRQFCFASLDAKKQTKFSCDNNTKLTSGQTSVNISCQSNTIVKENCNNAWFAIKNIPKYIEFSNATMVDFKTNFTLSVPFSKKEDNNDGTYNINFFVGTIPANSGRKVFIDWTAETKYKSEKDPDPVRRYKDLLVADFTGKLTGKSELKIEQEGEVVINYCELPPQPEVKVNVSFSPTTFCDKADSVTKTQSKTEITCLIDECKDLVLHYRLPNFIKKDPNEIRAYHSDNLNRRLTGIYYEEKPNNFYLTLGNLEKGKKFIINSTFQVDTVKQYEQQEENIVVDYFSGKYPQEGKYERIALTEYYKATTNQKIDEACCYTIRINKAVKLFKNRKRCIAMVMDESESMTLPPNNSFCTGSKCANKECVQGITESSLMKQSPGLRASNPGNDFESDEIFVIPFDSTAKKDFSGCDPGRETPSAGDCSQKAQGRVNTSGGGRGNMEDAIRDATDKVIHACGGKYDARYIYVYSDGIPTAYGVNYSKDCDFSKAKSEDDFFASPCFKGAITEAKRAFDSRVAIIPVQIDYLFKYNNQRSIEKLPEGGAISLVNVGKRLMQSIAYDSLKTSDPARSSCTLGTLDKKIADAICKGIRYEGRFIQGIEYVQNSANSGSYWLKPEEVYNNQKGQKVFDASEFAQSSSDYQTTLEFVVGRIFGFKGSLSKDDFNDFRITCMSGSLIDETNGRPDNILVDKNSTCRLRRP